MEQANVLPLIALRVTKIDTEIAKLRKAVIDGIYDERSIVGDATIAIEAQLVQVSQLLEGCGVSSPY